VDLQRLAAVTRTGEAELREWAAEAPYLADSHRQDGNDISERWYRNRSAAATDAVQCLAELRRDLDALIEVETAANRYIRALEKLCRRRDPEMTLQPLILASGIVTPPPRGTETLKHELA
jgi:hypothetical protein